MKTFRIAVLMATAMTAVAFPALAGSPGTSMSTGKDGAIVRVESAMAKHTEILTALLTQVPEQAREGIQKAIDASSRGHDTAVAALNAHSVEGREAEEADTESGTDTDSGQDPHGKPDTTGLMNARGRVATAFQESETHLQSVITTAPPKAAAKIQDALTRIVAQRALVLQTLDRLIAGQKPERGTAERALHASERPDHPEHPERPDRPERPDHPQPADQPDRPDHPGHGL